MRRLVLLVLCAGILASCGSSKSSSSSTSAASKPAAPAADASGCRTVAPPPPKGPQHLSRPRQALDPAKRWRVTLQTSCGEIVIELDVKRSPTTSASFAALVRRGFYDGLTFHRVAQDFVIQGGDPAGNGSGGPGYRTVEPPPRTVHYTRGLVAMAKTQTDPTGAAGSQFFVVTAEDATASSGLTPDYAVLGRVVSGLDVADRIGALPTNPPGDGAPRTPVVIEKATVSSR